MKTYLVNEWYHADQTGTGVIFRTNNEAEFVQKVREIRQNCKIAFQRIHETDYGVFYSFTRVENDWVKNSMQMWPVFGRRPVSANLRRKIES